MIRAALFALLLAGCATDPRAVTLAEKIGAGMPWFAEYQCPDGSFSRRCPLERPIALR